MTDRPLSRQPKCGACPDEWHLLPCECGCNTPLPGIYA